MPTAATFRSRLVARELLYGAWSVIPSPLSVRLLAAVGLDYVVIDLQHGGATEADLPAMTSAIRLAGAAPVARVRHAHTADIGRALDLGCDGVIVPNIDSAAQARQVAGAVRYPPAGIARPALPSSRPPSTRPRSPGTPPPSSVSPRPERPRRLSDGRGTPRPAGRGVRGPRARQPARTQQARRRHRERAGDRALSPGPCHDPQTPAAAGRFLDPTFRRCRARHPAA